MTRLARAVVLLLLAGCAGAPTRLDAPEPPLVDDGLLRRCAAPVLLPGDPVEAVAALIAALEICRLAAAAALGRL